MFIRFRCAKDIGIGAYVCIYEQFQIGAGNISQSPCMFIFWKRHFEFLLVFALSKGRKKGDNYHDKQQQMQKIAT